MNNSLEHYGVLGMKWGVHRANTKGTTYTYRSHSTKKYQKKATKAALRGDEVNAKKFENRAKRSFEVDQRMQKMAEHERTGRAIAKRLFLSPSYLNAVNRTVASTNMSRRDAALKNAYIGTISSYMDKSAYIRQDERKR